MSAVDMTTAPFAAAPSFRGIIRSRRRLSPLPPPLLPWKCDGCKRVMLGKHRLVSGIVQIVCKCNHLNTLTDPVTLKRLQAAELVVELEARPCSGCSRLAFDHHGVVGVLEVICKCGAMNALVATVALPETMAESHTPELAVVD